MIAFGASDMTKAYIGSTEGSKAYLGDELVWGGESPALPYDAEVEYLQCSGSQMIDTGINLASGTASVKLVFRASFSATLYNNNSLMVANSDPNSGVQIYTYTSNTIYNQGASKTITLNRVYTITTYTTASRRTIQLDNGSVTSQNFNRSISDGARLYLMNFPSWVSTNRGARGTYYSFDVYINDVIVREYIPVRVGTVGYMYDKISGELFGNAGSGSFTLGADVI